LHRWNRLRFTNHFHPRCRVLDERIKRHHRQYRANRTRRVDAVQTQQLAQYRGSRYGVAGKVCVANHQFVAMAHRAQRVQHVGI